MEYEQLGKQWGIDRINCRDEDGLFGESINNKDGIKTRGGWEFLNEVLRNGRHFRTGVTLHVTLHQNSNPHVLLHSV